MKNKRVGSSQLLSVDSHKQIKRSRNDMRETVSDYQNTNQNEKITELSTRTNTRIEWKRTNHSNCEHNNMLLLFKTSQRPQIYIPDGCVNYFARPLMKQKKAKEGAKYLQIRNVDYKNTEKDHPILISRSVRINHRNPAISTLLTGKNRLVIRRTLIKEKGSINDPKHTKSFAELFDKNDSLLSPW